jgi:hypothetical protein
MRLLFLHPRKMRFDVAGKPQRYCRKIADSAQLARIKIPAHVKETAPKQISPKMTASGQLRAIDISMPTALLY